MKLAIVAAALMVLGVAGIMVGTILRVNVHYEEDKIDYGVVLSAGSTSTIAYIYQWHHKVNKYTPEVSLGKSEKSGDSYSYKVAPGIASIPISQVGDYLEPIISWASSHIPKDQLSSTPIYLQGTGGLRQLSDTVCGAVLSNVRSKLMESDFQFQNDNVAVISGTEEAGYGFLAVNALYDRFSWEDTPATTYGSLELGGVSAEIAYQDSSPPENYSISFTVNTTVYSVFAQGIDGLGINAARYALNYSMLTNTSEKLVQSPCLPFGYSENVTVNIDGALTSFILAGTSDASSCQIKIYNLVASLIQSIPRPTIGDFTFGVADHYIKIKDFFKLKDNSNLLELQAQASSFCGLSYGDALSHHKKYADDVQNYCFNGLYAVTLLEELYGFDPAARHILWKKKIHHKSEATWALGYMIDQVNALEPDTSNQERVHKVRFFHTYGGILLLFISCLVFLLGFVLLILQRRRPSEYVPVPLGHQ